MIRVKIISGGASVADGYVWRSDVILVESGRLAMPLAVRTEDGTECLVTDLHEGPGYWALTLPEGSVSVEGLEEVPWAPPRPKRTSNRYQPTRRRSTWCQVFPRLPCC